MSCLITHVLIKPSTMFFFFKISCYRKHWTWTHGSIFHPWFWSRMDTGLPLLIQLSWTPPAGRGPEFSEVAPLFHWLGWIYQSFYAQSQEKEKNSIPSRIANHPITFKSLSHSSMGIWTSWILSNEFIWRLLVCLFLSMILFYLINPVGY